MFTVDEPPGPSEKGVVAIADDLNASVAAGCG